MTDIPTSSPRSTFVTVVAWIFTVLGGFATLIAILQNVMITVMFPQEAMSEAANVQDAPVFAKFLMAHPQVFFGAFLVASAVTFISAVGLLKRQNWARLIFVAILALGIVWNLGGLALMFFALPPMPPVPRNAPANFPEGFDTMWKLMMGFSVAIALVFAGLFGWIIKRVCLPKLNVNSLRSNILVNTDARNVPRFAGSGAARAGYQKRYAAKDCYLDMLFMI